MLNTPDNPRLHGAEAAVVEPTNWGAHVETSAAATGKYRAAHNEMCVQADAVCDICGSLRMARTGNCLTCLDCGTSGGC